MAPPDWLLPTQAARLLGIGKSGVRYLIKHGTFTRARDELGRNRLDPREVANYANTRRDIKDGRRSPATRRLRGAERKPGEITAAVFARLDSGETPADICKAEQVDGETMMRLIQQHEELRHGREYALGCAVRREQEAQSERDNELYTRRRVARARGKLGR